MKVLKVSYYAIGILLFLWLFLSWWEIAFNHFDPDWVCNSMNLINLMFGG